MNMDKNTRQERYERRKAHKLRDHQRFGKSGWVGGNPRYTEPKGWREWDSRQAHKAQGVAEITGD